MINNYLISIIVPMYFEEEVAKECYYRLKTLMIKNNINYEFIFINDGSKDNTINILEELSKHDKNLKIIDFSRNFGHQNAVTAGIFNCSGDVAVIMDADLQDPPELILPMIKKWKEGFNVVYGKRTTRKGENFFKLLTAKYFYKFLNYMSDISIPKDTGDFRLIDRKVINEFKKMKEKNRFIRGMISWIGFKQTYIEYKRQERFAGKTKYPLKNMLKLAEDGIISFSSKPLKIITHLGSLIFSLSILLFIYIIIYKLCLKNTLSFNVIIIFILFLFTGIQLLSLGILGMYTKRIYDESQERPPYIIKKKINFKDNN
ncbi:family 2 glycosyl transferase [Clostridium fallax]|uniref:glycosyltransferase family 2 protein n=1 Tax=Clostridium fallax TaxID=1533 RepID=UPI000D82A625|nr:family 2 glycosyl transferase [Clostridium fallax]